ncbi:hypothetical protein OG900_29350 [Streptomyces sp. NBC_00433]
MPDDGGLDETAARELTRLGREIAAALGRPPTVAELLEVLGWGAGSLRDRLAGDVPVPVVLTPRPRPRGPAASRAGELDDSVYADAGDVLSALADGLADAHGARPALGDLADLVARGLAAAGPRAAEGASGLKGVTAPAAKPRRRPAPGDVVAIPAADGAHHLAVVLARDDFGTAFGLFEGTHPLKPVSAAHHPAPVPTPLYADDEAVRSGRWPTIGHDDDLPAAFAEPEILHPPRADRPNLGPHGAAETAAGRLRPLTEREAREAGLSEPGFTQTYLWEDLERHLDAGTG